MVQLGGTFISGEQYFTITGQSSSLLVMFFFVLGISCVTKSYLDEVNKVMDITKQTVLHCLAWWIPVSGEMFIAITGQDSALLALFF
jgi:hypothetical protein